MARIQTGNFGDVVARPVEQARVSPNTYGASVGQTLEQVGTQGMRIAGQEAAEAEAEQKAAARTAAAEAKQAQREAAAEAKAAEREARRVKALTATAQVTNGLTELHDRVDNDLRTGALDKTKAPEYFDAESRKLIGSALETVDPDHRELVNATLLNNIGSMRSSIGKMVVARDRQDIKAGGLAYIEEMQRYAMRGPKEADAAINNVRTFWTATGPMAGEDAATASTRVQQFAERVRYQQATELVNADPAAALKALKKADYLAEMDPSQRTALIHTADTRVLQAQQRSALQAEAAARQQAKTWEAATSVIQAGKAFEPAYAAQLEKQFAGTPYAPALKALMADGPANASFAAQPVAVQAQNLMVMQERLNKGGANPDDIKVYERMDKAHKAALADIKDDPYKAAAERGVLTGLTPLTLDMKVLPAQLATRAREAAVVSQWTGREESLFRPGEAEKIGNIIQAMPPKDRAGALVALRQVMTPGQAQAFAEQLDPKDRSIALALAYADKKTTAHRYTSELILRGQQAKLDGTSTKGVIKPEIAASAWRAHAAQQLADVFPNQKTADDLRDAAELIMHGMAAEGGGRLAGDDMDRAVRMAVSGNIVEHNGRKIPLPAGLDEGALTKRLRGITPEQVGPGATVRAAGVDVPMAEFIRTLPGQQLMPYRAGQYVVIVGGRPVVRTDGKPVVIGVQ